MGETDSNINDIPEVRLHIETQVFTVRKDVLCEHSDYFRAMFSGNYVEKIQQDITIDVIDANSMNIILRYIELGLIDLSEYDLVAVGSLAIAANFLQITELIKQIEYCLDLQLSLSTWIETMTIAENSAYTKLEQLSAAFGLLSFNSMEPKHIPTIQKLFWYLSHPYLDTSNELDVFTFGFEWLQSHEIGADALLIILGCLDLYAMTSEDFEEIKNNITSKGYENSLAIKVAECLQKVVEDFQMSVPIMISKKERLCEMFTERVYIEALSLVKESKRRKLTYTAVIPMKLEFGPHFMYTFTEEKGFVKWLEVADKSLWGWNVASWGANKLVIVCGEHGRGTGSFMKDVKVYDTLRNEWIWHGVQLPSRRHAGVTIINDSMFVIGGVGGFRVVLDSAIIYDLKQRTYRKIAQLPDSIQSPAICSHKGSVYAAGQKNIYKYEDYGNTDAWSNVASTGMRPNRMVSFKDYIYCTQNYFSPMYRFQPGIDAVLEIITIYSHPAAAICNFNSRLLVFTRPMCGRPDLLSVEEYKGENNGIPKMVYSDKNPHLNVNDVSGSCSLVIDIPPLHSYVSPYHQKYISIVKQCYES